MGKDKEEIEKLVALTPAQVKSWKKLQAAVRECKRNKIYFYQCLETLYGLNGRNVKEVVGFEETGNERFSPEYVGDMSLPSVTTTCSFADDVHHVVLYDKD